jgi:hypothetical protein
MLIYSVDNIKIIADYNVTKIISLLRFHAF